MLIRILWRFKAKYMYTFFTERNMLNVHIKRTYIIQPIYAVMYFCRNKQNINPLSKFCTIYLLLTTYTYQLLFYFSVYICKSPFFTKPGSFICKCPFIACPEVDLSKWTFIACPEVDLSKWTFIACPEKCPFNACPEVHLCKINIHCMSGRWPLKNAP